jgi:hypothetical protein
MRRLAQFSRGDAYSSRRDYQTLERRASARLHPVAAGTQHLVLGSTETSNGPRDWGAVGGFLAASEPIVLTLRPEHGLPPLALPIGTDWQPFGWISELPDRSPVRVTLEWPDATVDVWGLTAQIVNLSEGVLGNGDLRLEDIAKRHLIPETFFMEHASAIDAELADTSVLVDAGRDIETKKCSYCGRWLPIDSARPGALSFHRHSAKATRHQNECRACKKWRINDSFNPRRTVDQLHESSVITRERKVLLREPEALQALKRRDGEGLKSQIWKRFDRKCFACERPLSLAEVRLDHTRPLSYLWKLDEHATSLCESCNGTKADKFPVDFYSADQLQRLSTICGLSIEALSEKAINAEELSRIRDDLPRFARRWDPRLFLATARRVKALLPNVDLFEELDGQDSATSEWLRQRLAERPEIIERGDD